MKKGHGLAKKLKFAVLKFKKTVSFSGHTLVTIVSFRSQTMTFVTNHNIVRKSHSAELNILDQLSKYSLYFKSKLSIGKTITFN